jgi:hypothetical protein
LIIFFVICYILFLFCNLIYYLLYFVLFLFLICGIEEWIDLKLCKALCLDINTLKQLCLQLRLNATTLIELVSFILDDKTMLDYQSSKKKRYFSLFNIFNFNIIIEEIL